MKGLRKPKPKDTTPIKLPHPDDWTPEMIASYEAKKKRRELHAKREKSARAIKATKKATNRAKNKAARKTRKKNR
jgi:hypothetical protein